MTFITIRQLEERHVANDIVHLLWNDKMDLLAIANVKGEVSLHRLIWQRVWTLLPDIEVNPVIGMAWRPDGKILAVGYRSGYVILADVENRSILHNYEIGVSITTIKWIQEKCVHKTNPCLPPKFDSESACTIRTDKTSKFLSKPSSLSTAFSSTPKHLQENVENNLISNQIEMNLLLIGTVTGQVHISIFGIFTCAIIEMAEYLNYQSIIVTTDMNNDLSLLYVTIKDEQDGVKFVVLKTEIFSTYGNELYTVALKHGHLKTLVSYLTNTLNATTEAWESILLEMDSKLLSYAANVPAGAVAADFLELLMFGLPSTEMEQFLIHDLTEKGLKKMGHSIELSYSNIQKLLLKHLTKVGQNITYHLAELRGMARFLHRYKALGLNESTITKAILSNGAFLVKSVEMQQVINHSMINYKAFFRWLYVVILRLTDEQIPPEIPKMTQQDLAYITEFLQNFDNIGTTENDETVDAATKTGFTMERLGQYLVDGPLTLPPNTDSNIWETFLSEDLCIKGDDAIIEHNRSMSLVQQHKELEKSIDDIFVSPKFSIVKQFRPMHTVNCLTYNDFIPMKITQINATERITMLAFLSDNSSSNGIYCLEVNVDENCKEFLVKYAYFYFKVDETKSYRVVDIKFYNVDILTVLLEENCPAKTAVICQLTVSLIKKSVVQMDSPQLLITSNSNVPKVNAIDTAMTIKPIEGMVASHFAVSGSRKVSVVLADNLKKIRMFEMEADDDEEEDADMTTRESDVSLQETSIIE